MKYIIFELVIEYLLQKNDLFLLKNFNEVNLETHTILSMHNSYKKRKSAYLLNKVIRSLEIENCDIDEMINDKRTFNYILNTFYSASNTNYEYIDLSIRPYKSMILNYKTDRLNPFRKLKLFKVKEFKIRMERNIMLNMALSHADFPYSHMKARELSEF